MSYECGCINRLIHYSGAISTCIEPCPLLKKLTDRIAENRELVVSSGRSTYTQPDGTVHIVHENAEEDDRELNLGEEKGHHILGFTRDEIEANNKLQHEERSKFFPDAQYIDPLKKLPVSKAPYSKEIEDMLWEIG